MTNPLPNPLPAGTDIWIDSHDDPNFRQRIHLTSPVHLLDEGMVEFPKSWTWKITRTLRRGDIYLGKFASGLPQALEVWDDDEFTDNEDIHVLVPPQETGKTLEDRVCSLRSDANELGHPWSAIMQKWADLFEAVLQKTSDRIDAQQKSIDALRAELKEARRDR